MIIAYTKNNIEVVDKAPKGYMQTKKCDTIGGFYFFENGGKTILAPNKVFSKEEREYFVKRVKEHLVRQHI